MIRRRGRGGSRHRQVAAGAGRAAAAFVLRGKELGGLELAAALGTRGWGHGKDTTLGTQGWGHGAGDMGRTQRWGHGAGDTGTTQHWGHSHCAPVQVRAAFAPHRTLSLQKTQQKVTEITKVIHHLLITCACFGFCCLNIKAKSLPCSWFSALPHPPQLFLFDFLATKVLLQNGENIYFSVGETGEASEMQTGAAAPRAAEPRSI